MSVKTHGNVRKFTENGKIIGVRFVGGPTYLIRQRSFADLAEAVWSLNNGRAALAMEEWDFNGANCVVSIAWRPTEPE